MASMVLSMCSEDWHADENFFHKTFSAEKDLWKRLISAWQSYCDHIGGSASILRFTNRWGGLAACTGCRQHPVMKLTALQSPSFRASTSCNALRTCCPEGPNDVPAGADHSQ
eukprot:3894099-Amphidinium_carterae.3